MTTSKAPLTIKATAGELDRVLKQLRAAGPGRHVAYAALGCVQLTAVDGQVRARMTDLELDITVPVGAVASGTGSESGATLLVNAGELRRFLKTQRKGDTITLADVPTPKDDLDQVAIGGPSITVQVWQPPRDEFPREPERVGDATKIAIDFRAAHLVTAAASTDDFRPILTGVHIDGPTYAATDSYRLHIVESPNDSGAEKMLVPARLFTALARWQGVHKATVTDRSIRFEEEGTAVWCRLIEGEYPNYEKLVPEHRLPLVELDDVEEFAKVEQVARLTSSARREYLPIVFTEGKKLAAHVKDSEFRLDVDLAGRASTTVAFNPRYLAATVAGSESPVIEGTDGLKPAVVQWTDAEGYEITRLLMPVRVQ